jgi:phosphoenolpyruvate carboxykinase (ATP)
MQELGLVPTTANLAELGIKNFKTAYWNLSPEELTEHAIQKGMGQLADSGALVIHTGEFTGTLG